jgi:Ca2+-binding RTX toxin-like protein
MKRWLMGAGCGVLLLAACSPGTTASSEPASGSADAPTSRHDLSRTEGSEAGTYQDAPQSSQPPPTRRVSVPRCFGHRPTIVGTASGDRIRGTSGNDVIVSLGGNDVIRDLNKDDAVCTASGNDRVIGPGHTNLSPLVDLGDGDDQMTHVEYAGLVRAGTGDDTIVFTRKGSGEVAPGAGDDLVRAVGVRPFGETPCVRLVSATGPVRVNLARGRATGEGHDRLVNIRCVKAGRFSDVLVGTNRGDEIWTGGGLNLVRVGAGDDIVEGGARADEVHLGPGDDSVIAGSGWDRLYGGPGTDQITGGPDGDYLDGGPGGDFLYSGEGCFTIWQAPVDLNAMMTGSAPNEVFGRAGNDFLAGERGNDRLDGGAGFDSGTGGYHDGRIDWATSLERSAECESP